MEQTGRLAALCEACGAGGRREAAEKAADFLLALVEDVQISDMGTVTGWRRCGKADAPVLLLEAHIDEIGLLVTGVDDGGFLRVAPCGGVDARVLAATDVVVYGDQSYPGVFGSTPPHLSGDADELPTAEERGIDVGMSREEVQRHIPLGSVVGFRPNFASLLGSRVSSKALDDRAGVEVVLRCLELLREETLDCDIAVMFAAQEELGCRGSAPAAFALRPDAAIAVDVSFGYTPDADRRECGVLGDGPMIGIAPTLDEPMTRLLERLAEREGIPFQREVMGGKTGTDADVMGITGEGVRMALLSIPLRYMHTPVEMADMQDVGNTARLMAAFVKEGGALL